MNVWESLGRTAIYSGSAEKASDESAYLTRSGIDAVVYHDSEKECFVVTVPCDSEGLASRLLQHHNESAFHSRLESLSHSPAFIRVNEKLADVTNSFLVLLICGGLSFAIALIRFSIMLSEDNYTNLGFVIFELILGAFFVICGIVMTIRSRKARKNLSEESAFTLYIINWITGTYSGDDIDSIILRRDDYTDLESARKELIGAYISREFDIPDDEYASYLTDEAYTALYEVHRLKPHRKSHK